jgi:hypothetical protein
MTVVGDEEANAVVEVYEALVVRWHHQSAYSSAFLFTAWGWAAKVTEVRIGSKKAPAQRRIATTTSTTSAAKAAVDLGASHGAA